MTEAWITIDTDALRDYFVSAGIDAAMEAALGSSQTDPTDTIIADVVRRIRSEIGTKWTLSENPLAIPQDLKWVACMLVSEQLCTRVPGLITLLDGSRDVIKDAKDYLKRIAAGDISIPNPTDPQEEPVLQQNRAPVIVSSITRKFTRDTLAGL
jgi:hypothetical protein